MSALADYFRCPPDLALVGTLPGLSSKDGFFRFGDAIGFGRLAGHEPATYADELLTNAAVNVTTHAGRVILPFDLTEVATNLREERYRLNGYDFLQKNTTRSAVQRLYYQVRPLLGVGVRKHLQKVRLRGWDRIPFPRWPVDRSVDALMESALTAAIEAQGGSSIPFIWFWPEGASACAMMTHDVEGDAGVNFCDQLMDIDDSFGIKSAFQLIPEGREQQWRRAAAKMRARGFEVNLHDLNHDGQLFSDKTSFLRQARRINDYAREFGCEGFRSGAMYREQSWFKAFDFAYDMSVPNAAQLEPQRGGCCTIMPYFVGNIVELPLTTVQDYSLFHILEDYSTTLWKQQIQIIQRHHGLISVIAHPDYLLGRRERDVYVELLGHLSQLRERDGIWIALPGDINRWWRNRQQMRLVPSNDGWRIIGPDSDRARIAHAALADGKLVYRLQTGPNRGT
jgi:hypothetical protein